MNRATALCCMIVAFSPGDAVAQPRDTAIIAAGAPVHSRVANLVQERVLGALDSPEPYSFGQISDVAVDRHGAVYVADYQGLVRKYDSTGKFIRAFGRKGEGPGEYQRPRGVAVADDGRVVVASEPDRRILVYDSLGRPLFSQRVAKLYLIPPGSGFLRPFIQIDRQQRIWVPISGRVDGWTRTTYDLNNPALFVRMRLDGRAIDTVTEPFSTQRPAVLTTRGNSPQARVVPFHARYHQRLSPLGYFVTGRSANHAGRYAIDLLIPASSAERARWTPTDQVRSLRVGYEAVPVMDGERSAWQSTYTTALRVYERGWQWNGKPIPRVKPPYRGFWIDSDGRVWVDRFTHARENTSERSAPEMLAGHPDATWPSRRWQEQTEFDVVEPSGRHVGKVRVAEQLRFVASRGDKVWAISTKDYMSISVKRFRIVWAD